MAKLQKFVPPSEPVFVIELTETELKHIVKVLGERTGEDAKKDGLDPEFEYKLFDSLEGFVFKAGVN